MTKKLSNLFNLPEIVTDPIQEDTDNLSETAEQAQDNVEHTNHVIESVNNAIDKIDAALPYVNDLDQSDVELDELADLAKDRAKDLIDLGMNMDPRFAGTVFQTAGVLLGHSITAKTAKMDKKLKMIQLQLSKMRLDHQIAKDSKDTTGETAIEGQGTVMDRNALLEQIIKMNKTNK